MLSTFLSAISLRSWSFLQSHLLEVSETSIQHLLEALETAAATYGPKERALSMVTPMNFGSEKICPPQMRTLERPCARR